MDKLIAALLNRSGVTQYPDANVYNSVTKIKPEDRPDFPVTVLGDDSYLFSKLNKTAGAVTDFGNKKIFVNRDKPTYKDPAELTALMAHEGVHSKGIADEYPAYQKQLDYITGPKGPNSAYVKNLKEMQLKKAAKK